MTHTVRPGFVAGTCSACGGRAERGRASWWHLEEPCINRGSLAFVVVGVDEQGTMRQTSDAERPARFIPLEAS